MNKSELIDQIAANSGLSKADAKKALNATTEVIKNCKQIFYHKLILKYKLKNYEQIRINRSDRC